MVQRLQNAGDAYIISKQTNLRIYQLFDRGKGKGGGQKQQHLLLGARPRFLAARTRATSAANCCTTDTRGAKTEQERGKGGRHE